MRNKSYKTDIIYNSIFRGVIIITPLIASPYLTRVLGAEKLGIYSAANALATYFVIFSLLGVNDYGNRSIAQVRENREKLSDAFWQIYYVQFFLSLLFMACYLITIFTYKKYFQIQLILAIYIFSSIIEINWFAFGMQEFRLTSIRSIVIRLCTVVCIFTFIKGPSDLWKYTLIIVLDNLVSLLVILPLIFKYTDFRKPDIKKMMGHLKPDILLFLPIIATSVYQYLSKIMLDAWSTEAECGFYQNAENIINLPTFLTTAIVTVMLPYASNLVAKGEKDENRQLLGSTLKYTSILNIAMAFGIFSVASDFIPWYLGKDFQRSAVLIRMMAPLIFINGFSNVLRYQCILPNEMDRANLISMFAGSAASVIANLLLIPRYGASGAAVSFVLATLITLIIQMLYVRPYIDLPAVFRSFAPTILFGVLMAVFVYAVSRLPLPSLLLIPAEILVGMAVYLLCTYIWLGKTGDMVLFNMLRGFRERLKK